MERTGIVTDAEIGKIVKAILSRGNDVEVKKNKSENIVIYEVSRKNVAK